MNLRNNHRVPVPLAGTLIIDSHGYDVEVRDISLTGARLVCMLPAIEVGARCRLALSANEGSVVDVVTVDGRVVYCDSDSCAVSFAAVDNRDFAQLIRWLGRHADEPTVLRDEIERGAIPEIAELAGLDR